MRVSRSRVAAFVVIGAILAVAGRSMWLPSIGGLLVAADPLAFADIAVMTSEADLAGAIELADLRARQLTRRVGAIVPEPSAAEREMKKRGVVLPGMGDVLGALGVPPEDIELIPAGEGGTTDGMQALAAWSRTHAVRRLIVVTAPDHGRRVKRALTRAFGDAPPELMMHHAAHDEFAPTTWWSSRRTLRSGLVELQKLALDYATHPLTGW